MSEIAVVPELPKDIDSAHAVIQVLHAELTKSQREIEQLRHRLDQLCRRLFGRSSEKVDSRQLLLAFAQLAASETDTTEESTESTDAGPTKKRKGHARRRRLEDLPRQRYLNDLPDEKKICSDCQAPLARIGEDSKERLDYVPSSVVILETVTPKYACPGCHEGVFQAPPLPEVIEKGIAGPGLLAYVAVSKYADHLPLNRLERILARHGVEISRKTMCDWVGAVANAVEPVYNELCRRLTAADLLQTDDTPVVVRDRKLGRYLGRIWVYRSPVTNETVFDFTETRERDGPLKFLKGFKGKLQADAYSGYDELFRTAPVVEHGCWAHARRKVHDALTVDRPRASILLAAIGRLYDVEREARAAIDDERRRLRQQKSRPILDEIGTLCEDYHAVVLPKSPLGDAVGYIRNQWAALQRYVDDGRVPIDNNGAERELRAIAVGRKNWLFAGSAEGGRRAAILFSLVACCRAEKVDPFAYLRDLLLRVATHPAARVAELTPSSWKTLGQQAITHTVATH